MKCVFCGEEVAGNELAHPLCWRAEYDEGLQEIGKEDITEILAWLDAIG
jgi:hypothetical protein